MSSHLHKRRCYDEYLQMNKLRNFNKNSRKSFEDKFTQLLIY